MNYEVFQEAVIQAAKAHGLADYELYSREEESISISAHQREIHRFSSNVAGGVCFRCIVDGKMGYASTELLNEEQAKTIVVRAIENARTIENTDPVFLHEAGDSYQKTADQDLALPTAESIIPFVLDCQSKAYDADPRVCDGTSSQFVAERVTTRLTNSRGLNLHNVCSFQGGIVGAVLEQDGQKYNAYDYRTGKLTEISRRDLVEDAVAKAASTIGAEVAESGKCPIVLDPEVMADFLAIFTPVFSADQAQKGLSLLKGRVNDRVAGEAVTLLDDPFYPGCTVQTSFDDEGVATFTKPVIENGVLKTLLHNLKTAAKDGVSSTGNGYKASYASSVSVAPYSFYLQSGKFSREELLEKAGNGIYLTEISGGHAGANAITGDFSLQSAGFQIENGKITKALRGFTVAGNFFDLLQSITAVGSDLKFGLPSGYTVYGSPSVLVTELSVAGK
ncbi:MAG: TldD/PmbA family protein [Candidatus Merdivicinus sp.]|jgi:PmbA protein